MSLETDAEKLRGEYDDLFGDDAYIQLSINYLRMMNEYISVERAKKDHYDSGRCWGYLRMRAPAPMKVSQKKKSDKKSV